MALNIGGLQRFSLLDFPDRISAIVFTNGCNFRCPFCHNRSLVRSNNDTTILDTDVTGFLATRIGKIDGVCISGGEPLMQPDLPDFIRCIRDMGFQVKLDTNGSFPDRLKALLNENLIDYVAMDIKNSPIKYDSTINCKYVPIDKIKKSAALLLSGSVFYEFRTTCVREFHTEDDIVAIGEWLHGAARYYLQNFRASDSILETISLHSFSSVELDTFASIARKYFQTVEVRM